jgi:hypothetical protein
VLTVVTWNMNHWQNSAATREAGWRYLHGPLADETGWDIATPGVRPSDTGDAGGVGPGPQPRLGDRGRRP